MLYHESASHAYLLSALLCFFIGTLLTLKRPARVRLFHKDAFIAVALSWFIMSIFGALPFCFTGEIPSFVDALFETVSGFTTTGASILKEVESLSYASLFWRSFTHWVGGMGVLVLITAILPLTGASTINLLKAESPGPSVSRLVPRVKDTAKVLYSLYLIMTALEIILLVFNGMPVFEALTTSFGTVGTGGFGVKNDSMASYTPALQNIVTVFMILSGVNYVAYFYLVTGRIKEMLHLEEVRWYFLIILSTATVIFFNIRGMYGTSGEALRHSFFQVGSIITTTGFATTDFNLWPEMSKSILIILMFIGACAGSTGGGIKVSRLIISIKTIFKELSYIIHPQEVRKVRMDGATVEHEVVRSTNVFMAVYFLILFGSTILISVDEFDFTSNFTAVAATLNNIGPGLSLVGPTENFSIFSVFSKCILIFDMLAGRLELFPVLIMLLPSAWKRK